MSCSSATTLPSPSQMSSCSSRKRNWRSSSIKHQSSPSFLSPPFPQQKSYVPLANPLSSSTVSTLPTVACTEPSCTSTSASRSLANSTIDTTDYYSPPTQPKPQMCIVWPHQQQCTPSRTSSASSALTTVSSYAAAAADKGSANCAENSNTSPSLERGRPRRKLHDHNNNEQRDGTEKNNLQLDFLLEQEEEERFEKDLTEDNHHLNGSHHDTHHSGLFLPDDDHDDIHQSQLVDDIYDDSNCSCCSEKEIASLHSGDFDHNKNGNDCHYPQNDDQAEELYMHKREKEKEHLDQVNNTIISLDHGITFTSTCEEDDDLSYDAATTTDDANAHNMKHSIQPIQTTHICTSQDDWFSETSSPLSLEDNYSNEYDSNSDDDDNDGGLSFGSMTKSKSFGKQERRPSEGIDDGCGAITTYNENLTLSQDDASKYSYSTHKSNNLYGYASTDADDDNLSWTDNEEAPITPSHSTFDEDNEEEPYSHDPTQTQLQTKLSHYSGNDSDTREHFKHVVLHNSTVAELNANAMKNTIRDILSYGVLNNTSGDNFHEEDEALHESRHRHISSFISHPPCTYGDYSDDNKEDCLTLESQSWKDDSSLLPSVPSLPDLDEEDIDIDIDSPHNHEHAFIQFRMIHNVVEPSCEKMQQEASACAQFTRRAIEACDYLETGNSGVDDDNADARWYAQLSKTIDGIFYYQPSTGAISRDLPEDYIDTSTVRGFAENAVRQKCQHLVQKTSRHSDLNEEIGQSEENIDLNFVFKPRQKMRRRKKRFHINTLRRIKRSKWVQRATMSLPFLGVLFFIFMIFIKNLLTIHYQQSYKKSTSIPDSMMIDPVEQNTMNECVCVDQERDSTNFNEIMNLSATSSMLTCLPKDIEQKLIWRRHNRSSKRRNRSKKDR